MKKVLLILAAGLCANVAQSAYLYWQVDASDYQGVVESAGYAQVKAIDTSSGGETVLTLVGDNAGSKIAVGSGMGTIDLSQLGNASAYSFYVELYNYNSSANSYDLVAKSSSNFSYTQLSQSNYIDVGDKMLTPSAATVWHGGSYVAVPEPTSAMLVMMGIGLLALKRKRV